MLSLETILKKTIKKFGFVTVKDFMSIILHHEYLGYYRKKNIVGKKGDFTTSPEISQVFGEIITNVFLLNSKLFEYRKNISFTELGPGRGFLAKDIIRTLKKLNSSLYKNIENIYFLEKSEIFYDDLRSYMNIME